MTRETRIALTEHTLRLAGNMAAEVNANHGEYLPTEARSKLRAVVSAIYDFDIALRSSYKKSHIKRKGPNEQ